MYHRLLGRGVGRVGPVSHAPLWDGSYEVQISAGQIGHSVPHGCSALLGLKSNTIYLVKYF